jgi:hypothetical protein
VAKGQSLVLLALRDREGVYGVVLGIGHDPESRGLRLDGEGPSGPGFTSCDSQSNRTSSEISPAQGNAVGLGHSGD